MSETASATKGETSDSNLSVHDFGSEFNENDREARDENNCRILTRAFLQTVLKSNPKLYYETPEINDILHLHQVGFQYLHNMELFPELKCLYAQQNGKFTFDLGCSP